MKLARQVAWMILALGGLAVQTPGQSVTNKREPHVGFVFPAGAQKATRVEVLVGGQNLRATSQVVVSGADVTARVIKIYRALRKFDKPVREEIQRRIAARRAVLAGLPVPTLETPAAGAPRVVMPEHPLLDRLEHADTAELDHLIQIFLKVNRKQMNVQLGEMATLEVTVAPEAAPGPRELRLLTGAGLTNPLRFEVGEFPEVCEREPNDVSGKSGGGSPVVEVPVVFNGQVLPGDVDRLRFHARSGLSLVVEVQARSLIPYLADAVPGWFQPVLSVRDGLGKELAYADDFRFRPDPVLMFHVPAAGDYTLEIRDSIFRGREDFVYRIKVSEQPYVTACFPLGAALGTTTSAHLTGWNLPQSEVLFDTRAGGESLRELRVTRRGMVSNPVAFAVDESPDVADVEPNDDRAKPQEVPVPCVVNGRIHQPGNKDVFRLTGLAGGPLRVEVWARRLGSPLDSVIRVLDAEGKVLAWNDDWMAKQGMLQLGDGLLTHHADSRVDLTLPSKGPVFVVIEDAQHHGGEAFAYRLHIGPAQPDFALRVTPSAINIKAGESMPVTVFVERRDGFCGPVKIQLGAACAGWSVAGEVVGAGHDHQHITVQAPADAAPGVMALHFTGTAEIGGVAVTRVGKGCDDTMQAFLWRHLVPARECLAAVMPSKGRAALAVRIGDGPVVVPLGGEARVRLRVPRWLLQQGMDVVALEAPDGLTVNAEIREPNEIIVHLRADAAKLKVGMADNLILGATLKPLLALKDAPKPARGRRAVATTTVLPAIPLTLGPAPLK